MRYFVTGATGFIGGRLAHELLRRGHHVVIAARNPAKAGDLAAAGAEIVQADITDKDSLRAPMTGADGVFHVAGWYRIGARDKQAGYAINVNGTRNVLELMRDLAIPKGVYTSTLAIYGDTHGLVVDESAPKPSRFETVYDQTKAIAHFDVALPMIQAGLPLVIVQPGMVYGPGDTSQMGEVWVQYLQRRLPMAPSQAAFTWAHVDDIVQGHILAMDKGKIGESYIIAGEVKTLTEALDLAEQLTGVPAPKLRPGPALIGFLASVMRRVEALVPVEGQMSAEALASLKATYIGSNAKARRELGYNPRPLTTGLQEMLDALMAQLGMSRHA